MFCGALSKCSDVSDPLKGLDHALLTLLSNALVDVAMDTRFKLSYMKAQQRSSLATSLEIQDLSPYRFHCITTSARLTRVGLAGRPYKFGLTILGFEFGWRRD